MKFVICTYARTGSTLLSNIIAGLFYPKEPIGFIDHSELNIKDFYDSDFNVKIISKILLASKSNFFSTQKPLVRSCFKGLKIY